MAQVVVRVTLTRIDSALLKDAALKLDCAVSWHHTPSLFPHPSPLCLYCPAKSPIKFLFYINNNRKYFDCKDV